MKGSLVALLCATAACCINASPVPAEDADAESTIGGVQGVVHQPGVNPFLPGSHHHKPGVDSVNHHESVEKPAIGSHVQTGHGASHEATRNPFLRGSQQRPSGGNVNHVHVPGGLINQQQSTAKPISGSHVQGVHVGHETAGNPFLQGGQQHHVPSVGHVNHVDSHLPTTGGFVGHHQSGEKPIIGSHVQGENVIVHETAGNPFLHGNQQHHVPSVGHESHVGSHVPTTTSGFINQQSGVKPVISHGQTTSGFVNQQTTVNPFLSGSAIHHHHHHQNSGVQSVGSHVHPSGEIANQQTHVNPFLRGSIVHHRHETPGGVQQNQQSGVHHVGSDHQVVGQQLGSHVHPAGGVQSVGSQVQGHPSGGVQSVGSHVHPTGNVQQVDTHVHPAGVVQPVGAHVHPTVGVQQVGSHVHPAGVVQPVGAHVHVHPSGGVQSVGSHVQGHPIGQVGTQQPEVQTTTDEHHHERPVATARKISDDVAAHHDEHQQVPVIAIIHQDAEVNPDGSHHNVWESENGIKVQEEGTVKVVGDVETRSVSGSIAYTDADGTPIVLTYTADENGFQPHGDHLPTPPPIPQSVARALEYIAAHPWVEEKYDQDGAKVTGVKEELPVIVVN